MPRSHAAQVERLQRKFAMIHSTLAQQQAAKADPDTPKLRQSADGTMAAGPALQQQGVNGSQSGPPNLQVGCRAQAARASACLCGGSQVWLSDCLGCANTCALSLLQPHPPLAPPPALPPQASADMSKMAKKLGSLELPKGAARGVLAAMR